MNYREELTRVMTMLAKDDRTIFLGQSVCFSGQAMFPTLEGVPMEKRIEMPIMEDTQMGMSIGLSLMGYIPISLYSRMDFLILAMNQLVNHLDKIAVMSQGEFVPKVIIRTLVGAKQPLDGGLQHTQDHTIAIRDFIPNIKILQIASANTAVGYYREALDSPSSYLIVEYGEKYDN